MFACITPQVAFPGLPHRRGSWCFADLGWASGRRCSPERAEWLYTSSRPPQHLQLCQSAVYNRLLHQQTGFCSAVLGYVFYSHSIHSQSTSQHHTFTSDQRWWFNCRICNPCRYFKGWIVYSLTKYKCILFILLFCIESNLIWFKAWMSLFIYLNASAEYELEELFQNQSLCKAISCLELV